MILSHYLNVDAVPGFEAAGFPNMMSQINPSEGSQFFIYHDRTVSELKKVVPPSLAVIASTAVFEDTASRSKPEDCPGPLGLVVAPDPAGNAYPA